MLLLAKRAEAKRLVVRDLRNVGKISLLHKYNIFSLTEAKRLVVRDLRNVGLIFIK